jgi:hypothetical protein
MTAVLPEALKLWVLGTAIGCSPSGVGAMASWKGKGRALPAGGNGALAGRRAAWQGCSRVGAMRTAQCMAVGSGAAVLLLEGACGALVAAVDDADSVKQERREDWGRDRASRKCLIISRIRRMDSVRDPVNHGIQKICYRLMPRSQASVLAQSGCSCLLRLARTLPSCSKPAGTGHTRTCFVDCSIPQR